MKVCLKIPDLIKFVSDRIYESLNQFFQGKTEIPGTNKKINSNDVNADIIQMEWDLHQGIEDIIINDMSFYFSKLLSHEFINTLSTIRKRILISLEFDVLDNGENQVDETFLPSGEPEPKIVFFKKSAGRTTLVLPEIFTRFLFKATHLSKKFILIKTILCRSFSSIFYTDTNDYGRFNRRLIQNSCDFNLSFIPFFHKRN
jgi:hypothetical protein